MAEKKKQHKVGERFTKCGIIYEVRKSEKFMCKGCALLTDEGNCLDQQDESFEPCAKMLRDDKQDVIFVKVGWVPYDVPLNSDSLTLHEADPTIRDEELDAEIDRWSKEQCYNNNEKSVFAVVARYFANWQKQQILKQAVPAKITLLDGISYVGEATLSQFAPGDKVKVIVFKD